MSEMRRRSEIQKTARIINRNFNEKMFEEQFERLISNTLDETEDFDAVYDKQLTYHLSVENYTKCITLRELIRS